MNSPPILNFPPEITIEIFSHYVDKPHDISWKNGGPLVLNRVCRNWREICLSTCSLWASVMLINDHWNWNEEIDLRFLQRWISRAGSHPLDLFVVPTPPSTFPGPLFPSHISHHSDQLLKLLPILCPYSSQWRTLQIMLYSPNAFPLDIVHGRVASLTNLTLSMLPGDKAVTAFRDAPSLRRVTLAIPGTQPIVLPWTQLTHLTLLNVSLEKCLEILKETPNLEVLDVNIPRFWEPPPLVLRLAHLNTFAFRDSQCDLLDCLTLPSLQTLQLYHLLTDDPARLLELGIRSAWSLRVIRLDGVAAETVNLYLRNLPSLEKVEISNLPHVFDPRELVEFLASDDQFLPALRELTITCLAEISHSDPRRHARVAKAARSSGEVEVLPPCLHVQRRNHGQCARRAHKSSAPVNRGRPGRSSDADAMIERQILLYALFYTPSGFNPTTYRQCKYM
ncbi:hypothetical protein B0H14DRAFT_766728 [Mycena olivaceomarginata]|nr:hypothetical protein B0H14DRAFT_766728 [Mycena olivaceomarginata]